jgi:hypothetical protein
MVDDNLRRAEGPNNIDLYRSHGNDPLRAGESESAMQCLLTDTVQKGPGDTSALLVEAYVWKHHKSMAKGRVTPDTVGDASAGRVGLQGCSTLERE